MAAANMLPNNSMNFTENQHGHAILETLRLQREQRRFCDVILHVQGQQFEAHRNVLASCSKYFHSMFKQEKVVKEQLTISCGGHEIFRCLLDYIYTGNVVIDKHNVSELVRLSNHFHVLKLRGHCSEYLERYMDSTNCLSVMDMAGRYQMAELLRTSVAFVKANIDDVLRQQEAMELPHPKVEQLIMDKELALSPEHQLTFILDWVRYAVPSRENELRQLLVNTPLQLVERGRLLQLVQQHPLLDESDRCLYLTLQSLAEAGVRFPAYEQLFCQMEDKYMQDLVVDSDTFLSMAISTAIEELEGTEATIFDGLHNLQRQAAVSSSHNPPPIETISVSAIDEADLAGVALAGEQETARDLRCHPAGGESRHLAVGPPPARYSDLATGPATRYTDYDEPPPAAGEPLPLYDKYQGLHTDEQARHTVAIAEHQRASQRQNGRFRSIGDGHEMAGLYPSVTSSGSGGGGGGTGDMQYMMVMKRVGKAADEPVMAAEDATERRMPEQGQTLGLQYMMYPEYGADTGGPLYCEPTAALSQCRFEARRHAEPVPAEPLEARPFQPMDAPEPARQLPSVADQRLRLCAGYETGGEARQQREQVACYLADGRVQYDAAGYSVCDAAELDALPTQVVVCSEPLIYAHGADAGRRPDLAARAFADERAAFVDERGEFVSERGRLLDERTGFVEELASMPPAPPPSPPPPPPPPPPLPMPAKKRKLDPGLAEELRSNDAMLTHGEPMAMHTEPMTMHNAQLLTQSGEMLVPNEAMVHRSQPVVASSEALVQPTGESLVSSHVETLVMSNAGALMTPNSETFVASKNGSMEASNVCTLVVPHDGSLVAADGETLVNSNTDALVVPAGEAMAASIAGKMVAGAASVVAQTINMSPKKKRLRVPPDPLTLTGVDRVETTDLAPLLAVSAEPSPPPPLAQPPRHHPCPRCASVFTLRSALDKHMTDRHSASNLKTYVCNICEMSSDKKSLYFKHMRSHFDGPPFTCNICLQEHAVFAKFIRHRREHVENKPHRCPECNISFWKKFNLTMHMRTHTGEKPHKCNVCGDVFSLGATLKQHMSKHTKSRHIFCDECDFSTKYANHMTQHKKTHTGDLHRCSHPTCDYTTPKRSHLREHLQAHAKRRTHHCPHCLRAFNVKTHLSRHLRMHDTSKILHCTMCSYAVHRSDRMKKHMETHQRSVPRGRKAKPKKAPAAETPVTVVPLATEWAVF